jgi:DNA-binding NarL/FixJ family response regulator
MKVCGEAASRQEALEVFRKTKPHLAIVDLSLRDSHGLELIKDMKEMFPAIVPFVLSMHAEKIYAERAIRAGARGYVTKAEASETIVRAVRQVLAGEVHVSGTIAQGIVRQLLGHLRRKDEATLDMLSDRELQIMELIAQGKSKQEIAVLLGLSVKTVDTYRERIKEKLGLANANAVLQYAIQWFFGARPEA